MEVFLIKSLDKEIGSIALPTPKIGMIFLHESKSYKVKEIIKDVPKNKLIVELIHDNDKQY